LKTIGGVNFTEKEFRHIKSQYLRFAKEENQCSLKCPMDWDDFYTKEQENYFPIVSIVIHTKVYFNNDNNSWCMCTLFKEFELETGCPCGRLGQDAFRRLDLVCKRLRRMK